MAFPRNSLPAFLSYARMRAAQALQKNERLSIVVGNESADLDSMTSAILFAYLRSTMPPQNAHSSSYIPILNISRNALRLRPEFNIVCGYAGVEPMDLLCLDDDCISRLSSSDSIRWLLVDHNRLTGQLAKVQSLKVLGVVDHHDEEGWIPLHTAPEPRTIRKCGSCTSLVVDYLKEEWNAVASASLSVGAAHGQRDGATLNDTAFTSTWDARIAKMALASILIDTANLTAPGKVEPVDHEAVKYLEARILISKPEGRNWNRTKFFEAVEKAKSDVTGITSGEMLIKDYKQWTEGGLKLGMSSLVQNIDFISKKTASEINGGHLNPQAAFMALLEQHFKHNDLDICIVMSTYTTKDGTFQREFLLRMRSNLSGILAKIRKDAVEILDLRESSLWSPSSGLSGIEDAMVWQLWQQNDLTKSRKQVAPLIRNYMNENKAL